MASKNPTVEVADYGTCAIDKSAYNDLFPISGHSIVSLCRKNSGLLVFPNSLGDYSDAIDDDEKSICLITSKLGGEEGWELHAGDIMGFVGRKNTELTIHSRFATNDENDFFLHYMVQKVFNINMFDLSHSTSQDKVFDFLLCLFPKYLKDALRQGLYRQYVVNKYNDSNVRGMIDVAGHVKRNIPFAGRIAYNVREYSYDNSITQLIRHTIEYIRSSNMSRVLKQDKDTIAYVSQICEATPSYNSQDRSKIVSKNLKSPTSPYYLGYIPLQKLCVRILNHKKLKYGSDSDKQIYGLLFVGYWLWEEYLSTILRDCVFTHAENQTGKNPIYLFNPDKYVRYPDFCKYKHDRHDENDRYEAELVLDTKYKHLEEGNEIGRDDIHQVISYMHVQKATVGGVIYPFERKNAAGTLINSIEKTCVGTLRGCGGNVYTIGVPIPSTTPDFDTFQREMNEVENDLRDKIAMME